MKILLITKDYPPRRGGIGAFTVYLEKTLKARGHEVILLNFDGTSVNLYKILKIKDFIYKKPLSEIFPLIDYLNPGKIFLHNKGLQSYVLYNLILRKTQEAITKYSPDIIHITTPELYAATYNCTIPYIVTCHSEELEKTPSIVKVLKDATIIHTISEFTKNKIIKNFSVKKPIITIHNPVDTSFYTPNTRNKTGILIISRLTKPKNIKTVILAHRLLPQNIKNKHNLFIIGTGPEEKYLKNLVIGDNNTKFLGNVTETNKVKILKKSAILVQCSLPIEGREEGFGMVFLEAEACGTPVIGSNVGGIPEAIGNAGIVVKDPNNEKELTRILMNLLNNEKQYKKFQDYGLKQAKYHSINNWIKKMEKIYENATKKNT